MVVAGLGDVPAMLLIAGGVLAGSDPEPGRELARVREAREVADLGDQPERGQGRDPAEAGQGLDLAGPPAAASELLEAGVQRRELALDAVEVHQHLIQGSLRERIVQRLASDPGAMPHRPRVLPLTVDPSVRQQLLDDTMTLD